MLELKTYKNWKEICKVMNWSTTGGDTKKKYLKLLSSLCKYHKEGNKFVIEEIYKQPKKVKDKRKNNKGNKEPKYLKYTLPILLNILSTETGLYEKEETDTDIVCYRGKLTDGQIFNRMFDLKRVDIEEINKEYTPMVSEKKLTKWEGELLESLYSVEYRILHSGTLDLLAKKYSSTIETLVRGFKTITIVDEGQKKCYEECIGEFDVFTKVKKLEETWRENNGGKSRNFLLSNEERKMMQQFVLKELEIKADRYQRVNSIEIYIEDKKVMRGLSNLRNEFRIMIFDEFIRKNVENIREKAFDSDATNKFEMPYKIDLFNNMMDGFTRYPKTECSKKDYRRLKRELKTLRARIIQLEIDNAFKDETIVMLKEEIKRLKEEK